MKILKAGAAIVALTVAGAFGAMAQDTDMTPQPPGTRPTTVTPAPATEGTSTGETGVSTPAGIPADPTTDQNVQPGPSTNTPNDPAAGSKPAARVPTSPPGTGSSSP